MILCFRGSDYRRSLISTWYDNMDNFLMDLGFTESKLGSNLYFKVEDGILVYVNVLTGEDELIVYAKRKLSTEVKMKYLGMMHYFLGMEEW